ncbi:trehalose-6-phosphate synthase [Cystobacter fuscus]|uniref:trehalose-6-phosphate synthase n=1 Tax=Cystobacter fuscus TaxID=43 RepID=UPI002B2F7A23|nr:trehalose-6-phosphate synthase [Cystobacter fuscus]
MSQERIFLASKRAPVTYHRDASGALTAELAPGGTANVVADLASQLGVSWIACAMTEEDRYVATQHPRGMEVQVSAAAPVRLHLLQHDPAVFEDMQEIITADLLWASNNYLWDGWTKPTFDARIHRAWKNFERFTETFATTLLERSKSCAEPVYLLHDYQMCGVPQHLRAQRPTAPQLLFVHIPWPSADYWRMLPRPMREGLLRGMLGADVIAFFAHRWVRNFLACVEDLLPEARVDYPSATVRWEGRTVRAEAMALGYSPSALDIREGEGSPELDAWIGDHPLVVHSGRTDPIKNAERAVLAFTAALQEDPGLRHARLLVKMNPNRLSVEANQQYRDRVGRAVEAANRTLGGEVVRMVCTNSVNGTFAALKRADVLLLNSTVDGQNLTAFEGTLFNQRDAVLILSERCGAAEALANVSRLVNPFDIVEQAQALKEALRATPAERAEAARRRREVVLRYDLPTWVRQQLSSLGLGAAPGERR